MEPSAEELLRREIQLVENDLISSTFRNAVKADRIVPVRGDAQKAIEHFRRKGPFRTVLLGLFTTLSIAEISLIVTHGSGISYPVLIALIVIPAAIATTCLVLIAKG